MLQAEEACSPRSPKLNVGVLASSSHQAHRLEQYTAAIQDLFGRLDRGNGLVGPV